MWQYIDLRNLYFASVTRGDLIVIEPKFTHCLFCLALVQILDLHEASTGIPDYLSLSRCSTVRRMLMEVGSLLLPSIEQLGTEWATGVCAISIL
jgi:hypothetical protein